MNMRGSESKIETLDIIDDSSEEFSLEYDLTDGEKCPSGHNSFVKDSCILFSKEIISPDKKFKIPKCKSIN